MTWHALYFPLKSGSEAAVAERLHSSAPLHPEICDDSGRAVGRLLGTIDFVGHTKAIRGSSSSTATQPSSRRR